MSRPARSITARLTAWFSIVSMLVVGLACLFLYFSLKTEITRRETEELMGKLALVEHRLYEARISQRSGELAHVMDDIILGHGDLRIWVTTAEGGYVYGDDQIPLLHVNADESRTFIMQRKDGGMMRALSKDIVDEASRLKLVVAVDIGPTRRILLSFGVTLVLVTLTASGLAALLGYGVATRGLRSLHSLSTAASRISPQSVVHRLPDSGLPSELESLARSFNGVLQRLERAYLQMEAFNADVAHELRTPLANMISGSQVALSRVRTADDYREILTSNLEDMERLTHIVNDMLFLAQADSGSKPLAMEQVDLGTQAGAVVEFFDSSLQEAGIEVQLMGSATVAGNTQLLRRALSNIISNAIRHSPRGARIEVRIGQKPDIVSLSVVNPGPLIPPEHLQRIFDRFYRANSARAGGDGYGLGLAIVRAIAQMHGAEVFARSENDSTEIGLLFKPGVEVRAKPQPV